MASTVDRPSQQVIVMFKQINEFLKTVGLRIENRGAYPSSGRQGIDHNNESLGAAPELSVGGGWDIDWDNPNDPLRRAILGQGPKRPFGK
jgi:hypothetical protein